MKDIISIHLQKIKIEVETGLQFDNTGDLVPTLADLQRFGFKLGQRVKVTIES